MAASGTVMSSDNEQTPDTRIITSDVSIKASLLTESAATDHDNQIAVAEYTQYYKTLLRCIMVNTANHIR